MIMNSPFTQSEPDMAVPPVVRTPFRNQRGMTLIELIVVLGILAGLATLALTSMGSLDTSARRETTEHLIDQIELAVAGDGRVAGRFVSDMGRLPVLHGSAGSRVEGQGLEELWDDLGVYSGAIPDYYFIGVPNPSSLLYPSWESQNVFPAVPTDKRLLVNLPGGWRGPYLNAAGDKLFDGFGNNLAFYDGTNPVSSPAAWGDILSTSLSDGDLIPGIRSFGSDNSFTPSPPPSGTEWNEEDVFIDFTDDCTTSADASAFLSVSIRVRNHRPPYPWKTPDNATIANWQASIPYSVNNIVRAVTGDLFVCDNSTGSSLSGASPPSWSQTGTISDNELTWRYIPWCSRMDRMRVALFAPYADTNPANGIVIREVLTGRNAAPSLQTPFLNDSESANVSIAVTVSWNGLHDVTLFNLPPGLRALYVYGYAECGTEAANGWSSGHQMIELKPGVNHVTVYLSEPL